MHTILVKRHYKLKCNRATFESVLPTECFEKWETKRPERVMPTLKSFISFLESRIVILTNSMHQLVRHTRTEDTSHRSNGQASTSHHGATSKANGRHSDQKRSADHNSNGHTAKRHRPNDA